MITQYRTINPRGDIPEIEGNEITYLGNSMYPSLIEGDLLILSFNAPVKTGDIIVFPSPERFSYIIHRVICIKNDDIKTAGDNNKEPDHDLIHTSDVIGKVIAKKCFGRIYRIRGRIYGKVYHSYISSVHRSIRRTLPIIKPAYYFIARKAVMGRIFFRFIRLDPIVYVKDGNAVVRLFLNDRYIGQCRGGGKPWVIRAPFLLLVDPDRLPRYETVVQDAMKARQDNKN